MGKKPWHSTEWRKNRAKLIEGKSCEWCGSKEALVVHHKETFYSDKEYNKFVLNFIKAYFENRKSTKDTRHYYAACPACGSSSLQDRQNMKTALREPDLLQVLARGTPSQPPPKMIAVHRPRFKCYQCKHETDSPVQKLEPAIMDNEIDSSFYNYFLELHRGEIDKLFSEKVRKSDEKYKSFKDVVILCKRCHLAHHKGLVLCKSCKKNYHAKQYPTCWDCIPDSDWKKTHKKIEVTLPCGSKVMVEAGFWDFGGMFDICLRHCPNGEGINSCYAFAKWQEDE